MQKKSKKDAQIFCYVYKRFDICIRKGQQNTLKTMKPQTKLLIAILVVCYLIGKLQDTYFL
jgi:hypothetical protein